MKLLIAEDELDPAETLTVNIAYFSCVLLFITAIPISHTFLRKIKYENALSRLHSLNAANDLPCCITDVENAAFVSNCAEVKIIFALYNAIFGDLLVDSYTNICYSIFSILEEG